MRKLSAFFLAALLGGCSLMPTGYGVETQHTSAPLQGYPLNDSSNEDSLNVVQAYLYWERRDASGVWYTQAALGYRIGDGGFYVNGTPILFQASVGKRFRFRE